MSDTRPPEDHASHRTPDEAGQGESSSAPESPGATPQPAQPEEGPDMVFFPPTGDSSTDKPPVLLPVGPGDNSMSIFVGEMDDTELFPAECVPADGTFADGTFAEDKAAALPLWPAFVAVCAALVAAFVASGMTIGVAAAVTGNIETLRQPGQQMAWLIDLADSPLGLALLVLPGQLAFAATAFGAALISRERWTVRLGLRRGKLPVWTWPLFMVGTPVIGMLAAQLITRISSKPSEQLQMMERLFQFDSLSTLIALLLLVSLLPGIAEELLFRGFVQRRLLARLPVATAIVLCSFFFAVAHMDVMHAVGVFPLGIWLGVIAWRADSIWPAVLAHIGNNAFAIIMAKVMGNQPNMEELGPVLGPIALVIMLCFAACLVVLLLSGSTRKQLADIPLADLPPDAREA